MTPSGIKPATFWLVTQCHGEEERFSFLHTCEDWPWDPHSLLEKRGTSLFLGDKAAGPWH